MGHPGNIGKPGAAKTPPRSWFTPEVSSSAYILLWLSEMPCCKTAGIGGPGLYKSWSVHVSRCTSANASGMSSSEIDCQLTCSGMKRHCSTGKRCTPAPAARWRSSLAGCSLTIPTRGTQESLHQKCLLSLRGPSTTKGPQLRHCEYGLKTISLPVLLMKARLLHLR